MGVIGDRIRAAAGTTFVKKLLGQHARQDLLGGVVVVYSPSEMEIYLAPSYPKEAMKYKVAFETLGCRLNQAETASLHRSFLEKGYGIAEDITSADLCVVNTCALTSQAVAKCRRKVRSIVRKNPNACIAVVGCYAQVETEVLKSLDGIDYIVGTADKLNIADLIPEPVKLPDPIVLKAQLPRDHFKIPGAGYYPIHTRANIKIQEGCDFVCSFCIIPKSRGPARSRDFDDIIREAKVLASEGHREMVLTGINLGTYRHGTKTLKDLVGELSTIDAIKRVRLSSIEPTTVDVGFFERMTGRGKLCPYLHISLQSGDDEVLGKMRRRYTAAEYRDFVDLFLSLVPAAGIGTDVMVGFPGEDESAFEKTYELVKDIPFTNIHVFSFSARKGTAAYLAKNRVPNSIVNSRCARMQALARRKKEERYRSLEGADLRVLFEETESSGFWVGFSDNYVKVGVEARDSLSNRLGIVRINGIAQTGPSKNLLAVGEIRQLEEASGVEGVSSKKDLSSMPSQELRR